MRSSDSEVRSAEFGVRSSEDSETYDEPLPAACANRSRDFAHPLWGSWQEREIDPRIRALGASRIDVSPQSSSLPIAASSSGITTRRPKVDMTETTSQFNTTSWAAQGECVGASRYRLEFGQALPMKPGDLPIDPVATRAILAIVATLQEFRQDRPQQLRFRR